MEEYQKRVVKEKDDLDIKIKALQKFQEGKAEGGNMRISIYDRADLSAQLTIMYNYSQILKKRINRF